MAAAAGDAAAGSHRSASCTVQARQPQNPPQSCLISAFYFRRSSAWLKSELQPLVQAMLKRYARNGITAQASQHARQWYSPWLLLFILHSLINTMFPDFPASKKPR